MGDELGMEFSAACSKLRNELRLKTGDGRLRDLEAWLDYDSKSVFLAALWSDDEGSIAVRFSLRSSLGMTSTAKLSSKRPKPASDPRTTTRPD